MDLTTEIESHNYIYLSQRDTLLKTIKNKGFVKYRNNSTFTLRELVKWELDDMVDEGVLNVRVIKEGGFFGIFTNSYNVYEYNHDYVE